MLSSYSSCHIPGKSFIPVGPYFMKAKQHSKAEETV